MLEALELALKTFELRSRVARIPSDRVGWLESTDVTSKSERRRGAWSPGNPVTIPRSSLLTTLCTVVDQGHK